MTFKHNPVYLNIADNIAYLQNPMKVIPEIDVFRVNRYVGGDHAEILYGKSHGASLNPKLAAEEFLADRNKYFEVHKMREGQKLRGQGKNTSGNAKQEILAHHVYLSCSEAESDRVSAEMLNEIMDRFLVAMGWDDHRSVQSPHLNTAHRHIHASVCAYSRGDGKKKLHMKNATVYKAKMELNYICVDYGLSFIDDAKLYVWASHHAPEYCIWIDEIKKNKTVEIHENISLEEKKRRAEERKAKRAAKVVPPKNVQEEVERVIAYNHSKAVKKRTDYDAGGRFINHRKNRPYRINLYDHTGRRRTTMELVLLLVMAMLVDTNRYAVENKRQPYSRHSWELQRMMDALSVAREYGVTVPADIQEKLAECGSQIGSYQKAIARLNTELQKGHDARLQKELEKQKQNLMKAKKDYACLINLKKPIREIVQGEYNYRTEELLKERNSERKCSLADQILQAEKKKQYQHEDKVDIHRERAPVDLVREI